MTIKQYEKNGEKLFYVRVHKRSKNDPAIMVEKYKSGFKTWKEAHKAEKNLYDDTLRKLVAREHQECCWKTLVDRWEMALRKGEGLKKLVGRTTAEDYIGSLRLYTRHLYNKPVDQITTADIRSIVENEPMRNKSNSRKRMLQNSINGAYKWAIENQLVRNVHRSPAIGISISREQSQTPEILNISEIKELLVKAREANHPWFPIWAMALLAGMRSGELHALLWSDIDWEKRMIKVSKSYNRRKKSVKETKGGYWRTVPMNSQLEGLLKELRATSQGRIHVLPRFVDWDRGEQARVLRTFCAGVGITSVKFHTLRACFTTELLRQSVAPAILMQVCGWKGLKTMQHYVRLSGIDTQGATEKLQIMPAKDVMEKVVHLYRK